jgi:predicted ATPase
MRHRHGHAEAREALRELVHDRLRLLEPPVRTLVECASLLGYRLDAAALAACAGADLAATVEALRQASDLDLIVAERDGSNLFRFRHALTQAAVRDALDHERKQMLHATIAAALERLPDAGSRAEQLAHHWSLAGDRAKAAPYEVLAARRAQRFGVDGGARID